MVETQAIINDYKRLSGELRLKVLSLYKKANAGHIGCSLSCIDLLIAALIQQKRPQDSFLLSKGHAAAALYVSLNYLGEISDEVLETFYQDGTTLPAHPAPNQHVGIPFATGSLGHGLPIATGIAHANKLSEEDGISFVLMSDGETNEGTTWEAAHYAIQNRLDNLIVLIDKNGLQGFGNTTDVLGDTATASKWRTIGFDVFEAEGHNPAELVELIDTLKSRNNGLPKVIIAHTVKGKGVSYMENRMEWHYLPMSDDQYETAKTDVVNMYLS
ncbi:transketolase [Runella slithyformis]|uniref:Transketolase n=1 Tax=Runella slithyformis (strain ATCC 29530 / DSM 19594 / LMG 11500 / NCIMB 11436 / LSU 4) TaxID=761193 RepID=A0A7U4E7M0_RUNSL|nr:transketolase [Runella slithyformis]AEI50324.1 Transketolase [Runella slithyformis DSM 19594]